MEPGVSPAYGEPAGPRVLWPLGLLPPGFAGATGSVLQPRSLTRVCIETTSFDGTFVYELLRSTLLPAVAVRPDRDKGSRTFALAARYEAGTVYHLVSAPGLADLEYELVAFPNGQHDDLVDAAVYGAALGAPEPVKAFPGGRFGMIAHRRASPTDELGWLSHRWDARSRFAIGSAPPPSGSRYERRG
jgi:hypothetical protein